MIIPALHQRHHKRGYLSRTDLDEVAQECNVPLHRVHSVVSFYPHFRTSPPPTVTVHVCRDMSCHLRGSVPKTEVLAKWASKRYGDSVEVCGVSCLGRCDRAPAVMVNEKLFANADEARLRRAIAAAIGNHPLSADSDWDTVN